MDDAPVPVPLVRRGLSRRRFLAVTGGTAGVVAATAYIRPSFLLGEPAGASPATGNTLVQVFLRGGADGLSLVPPLGDSTYQSLRPGIAVTDSTALALDGRFGLHPAATRLKALYDTGRLALIPASGSPNSTRSHFEAQDLIEKGTPGSASTPDGWFGRWMNQSANPTEPTLRGVGIGYGLQAAMRGSAAVATPDLSSLALSGMDTVAWTGGNAEMTGALTGMFGGTADPLLKAQGAAALALVAQVGPIAADGAMPDDWPDHFGAALWPIARLIKGGVPVEAAAADLGGWDTHDSMGSPTNTNADMHKLVAELDAALGLFFAYLGPQADKVTVVVMSEFGRRIAGNGSGGLDHGRGQAMMVIGGGVSKGVKGTWPGLTDTDSGDVKVVNDYRAVVSEVLAKRMRTTDLGSVFPGFDTSSSSWLGVCA